jgi:hypothetical protein
MLKVEEQVLSIHLLKVFLGVLLILLLSQDREERIVTGASGSCHGPLRCASDVVGVASVRRLAHQCP